MITHYKKVIRKDARLITVVIIFIALGFFAVLAGDFYESDFIDENPAIVNHPRDTQ